MSPLSRPALLGVLALTIDAAGAVAQMDEPVIGLPCEGCEAVFDGIPDELSWEARIGHVDEPGETLIIDGVVYDLDGRPRGGVILYAYHTDASGVYPEVFGLTDAATRHGRLRGWVQSDERGRFRFKTIRPASYPNATTPAHVHLHVIEPGCCTYYVNAIHFADDPRLTPEERKMADEGRGGEPIVPAIRDEDGTWIVRRDILLGVGIPDYATPRPNGR